MPLNCPGITDGFPQYGQDVAAVVASQISSAPHDGQQFFKESGNQAEVINKLYIHRNTLKYRLDRIQEITGKNPRVFEDLFYLYTAYILHKLKK